MRATRLLLLATAALVSSVYAEDGELCGGLFCDCDADPTCDM